jgi:hypothetical protein
MTLNYHFLKRKKHYCVRNVNIAREDKLFWGTFCKFIERLNLLLREHNHCGLMYT